MPDTFHQALEKHIDTEHPDLAKALNALADLQNFLDTTTFDFRVEAPSYIDSTRMVKALNVQDYIRALQLGGYGHTVVFPFSSFAAAGNFPVSLYNYGQKNIVIYSISLGVGATASPFQINRTIADPNYAVNGGAGGINLLIANHKIGIGNVPAVSATATTTTQTIPPGQDVIFSSRMPANQPPTEIMTNNHIYILTEKSGITLWFTPTAATNANANFDIVELPF